MNQLLLILSALLLVACASVAPALPSDNHVAVNFQRPDAGAFIVMPPPEVELPKLQPGLALLKSQLHKQRKAASYRVAMLDESNYATIWAQEVQAVGGIYDPVTGNPREAEFSRVLVALAQRVSAETKAVLILRPRLIMRTAKLTGAGAVWDGQQRRVPTLGLDGGSIRYDGNTQGVSVQLIALTSNGALALRTYGGASLPWRANLITKQNEFRPDLFDSDGEVSDAVALALGPLAGK